MHRGETMADLHLTDSECKAWSLEGSLAVWPTLLSVPENGMDSVLLAASGSLSRIRRQGDRWPVMVFRGTNPIGHKPIYSSVL